MIGYSWEYCSIYGLPGYDEWKTRSDDERICDYYGFDREPFYCDLCDDHGCPECCPLENVSLEDLDELDYQIAQAEGLT